MSTRALRPLALGEIIDTAFKIYKRHWRALLTLVAVVVIPAGIIQVLIMATVSGDLLERLTDPGFADDPEALDVALRALGALAAAALVQVVAAVLANAGIMRAVAEIYVGYSPDWRESLGFATRRIGSVLGAVFLMVLAIGAVGTFLALGIASSASFAAIGASVGLGVIVWLVVSWAVVVPALVVESLGPTAALGRSLVLVRGRWWPTLGALLTAWLIVAVVGWVAGTVLGAFVPDSGAAGLLAVIEIGINVATIPFLVSVLAVVYFDLRTRNEPFDLARLAADIGVAPPPDGPDGGSGPPGFPPPDTPTWPPLPPESNDSA